MVNLFSTAASHPASGSPDSQLNFILFYDFYVYRVLCRDATIRRARREKLVKSILAKSIQSHLQLVNFSILFNSIVFYYCTAQLRY